MARNPHECLSRPFFLWRQRFIAALALATRDPPRRSSALLKNALKRTAQAAEVAGIPVLLVHAKDDAARQWYLNWEFESRASDPFQVFLLMQDGKASVGKK